MKKVAGRIGKKAGALLLALSLISPQTVLALPTESQVVKGNVTFDRSQDGVLNITSDSKKSIIKYQDFNIGANESVNFFLPNVKSLSLNKVIGSSGSSILGTLTANGRIILVNPNGINFGSSANVKTGGLIASTLDISDANFLNNNYLFSKDADSPFASVTNQGTISADEFAVLMGSAVDNQGVIQVPLGTAALASGDVVTLGISDSGLVSVAIDEATSHQVLDGYGNSLSSQIANSGLLEANGGTVILTAESLENLFQTAINQTGVIRANSVTNTNGTIEITASGSSAELGGSLEASNFHITEGTTVNANDAQLTVAKDWNNEGTFNGDTSSVTFTDASRVSNISGDNTFYDFSVITPGKTIAFEAGSLQTILGTWKTQGAYGEHVKLISQTPGEQWLVDPRGTRDLTYTWVEDSYNIHSDIIIMTESTNRGGSFNWDPVGTWTGAVDNDWTTSGNWSGLGGATPGAGDDIIFNGTSVVNSNIDNNFTITSLSINSGYTGTLTLQNDLIVTGNFSQASGTFDLNGKTMTVGGNWTKTSGTFTPNIGTAIFNSAGTQNLNGGGSSFYDILHSGTGTLQLSGALTATNEFTNDSGVFSLNGNSWTMTGADFFNNATVKLQGSEIIAGLVQDINSGTWMYVGTNNGSSNTYTIRDFGATDYFNLTINHSGGPVDSFSVGAPLDVDGDFLLQSGNFKLNGQTMTLAGNWTRTGGSFTPGTGTVDFDGTNPQTLNSGGASFYNLTHSGNDILTLSTNPLTVTNNFAQTDGTFNANGLAVTVNGLTTLSNSVYNASTNTQTFNGGFTLNSGTFNGDSGAHDFNGPVSLLGGSFNATGGNMFVSNNFTIAPGGSFNPMTGTVIFDGGSATIDVDGTETFNNLTINSTGTKTIGVGDSLIVNGLLTLTDGNMDTGEINAQGGVIHGAGFDGGTGLLSFNGSPAINVNLTAGGQLPRVNLNDSDVTLIGPASGAVTFDGLFSLSSGTFNGGAGAVILNGGYVQSGGSVLLGNGAFTSNGDFSISGGVFTGGTGTVDVNGDLFLSGGFLNAPTGPFLISGNWSKTNGTFAPGTGTVTFDKASGIQTLDNDNDAFFNNLTHSGLGTLRLLNNTLDVNGSFTNTAGTFDMNTQNMTVGGNWTFTTGTFLPQTRTVTFDGGDTQDLNSGSKAFYGLTHSGAGTLRLMTSPLVVTNNFINSNGTFDANGIAATFNGLATISGGTYLAKSGTQTFNGGLTVSGGIFTGSTGTVDVNSNLLLSSGTLNAPTGPFLVSGDWTKSGGTYDPGTGTVTFDKSSGFQELNSGGSSFYKIVHSGAGTLEVDSDLTVTSNFTNNAGTFWLNGFNWTMTGATFSNNGNILLDGDEAITGLVQDIDSGTWSYGGDGVGGLDLFTVKDFGAVDYFHLTIWPAITTEVVQLDSVNSLSVAGDLSVIGDHFSLNGSDLSVAGNFFNLGTVTLAGTENVTLAKGNDINSGTWEYVGDGNVITGENLKDFGSIDYFNLRINTTNPGDTIQIAPLGAVTVAGDLTMQQGTFSLFGRPLTLTGNFTNNSSFDASGGTVIFNKASGTQTIGGTATSTFFNVTHSGLGTLKLANNIIVTNNFSNNAGTFDVNGQDWTMTGAVFSNIGTVKVQGKGSETVTGLVQDINSGTWLFAGDGDSNADTFDLYDFSAGGADYFNLNINTTDANDVIRMTNDLGMDGLFTVTSGTLSLNGRSITSAPGGSTAKRGEIVGTIRLRGEVAESVFWTTNDINSGTWEYVGDGVGGTALFTLKDFGSTDYFNLRISGDASETFQSLLAKTVAGSLTLTQGTYDANGFATLVKSLVTPVTLSGGTYLAKAGLQTFSGGLTVSGGTFTGSTGAVDVNGNLTLSSGTLTAPTGAFTVAGNWDKTGGTFTPGAGTVTFDKGSGTQTLNSGGSGFNNLRHSGTGILQLITNNLTVGGAFTNIGGNFDTNGLSTTVTGLATLSKGAFLAKTALQTFNGGLTLAGGIFTGSSGAVDINGNMTLTSGTLTAPSAGALFTVSGNWTKSSGTFAHNGGTVTLDGLDQTISGTNTFFNLTKTDTTNDATDRILTFKNSVTQTILGVLTLTGIDADDRINLVSDLPGTQWKINPAGAESINWADVRDSNSLSAINTTDSIGAAQNNINWSGLA